MAVGIIFYLVSNRNANIDVASQANREQPPVIMQQPAPAQQAPVIIQQPAQTSQRDSASDDANMQEVATKRLSEELDMIAVSVTIALWRKAGAGGMRKPGSKNAQHEWRV